MTHAHDGDISGDAYQAAELLQAARQIAASAEVRAAALDRDGTFPAEDVRDLHEAGLLLAPFPFEMGGSMLGSPPSDPSRLLDILVAIGGGSLSLARIYEGHVNAVKLVMHYGDAANLALLLSEARKGRPSGVWMAEDGEPLRLEQSAGGLVLNGRKILASGSGWIRRPLVAAQSDGGSIMVIPYIHDMGRARADQWTVHGMRATSTGTVDFTGITVDKTEIVGKPNDYLTSPLFRGGAWRVIAVQLGGLDAIMRHYSTQLAASRGANDPLQLARYGQALIAAETARLWVAKAAFVAEEVEANASANDTTAIDAYVDLARNAFEAAALSVVACTQKAIGLRAFTRPNVLERIIRDLTTYLRQPGLDGSLVSAASHHLHRSRDTAN